MKLLRDRGGFFALQEGEALAAPRLLKIPSPWFLQERVVTMADPFNLSRFVVAQDGPYETALAELRAGRKQSHWMWFIFPQLRGLGRSPRAILYSIGSLEEARAYLAHPVLGSKLLLCTQTVLAIEGRTLHEVFGSPDDAKFCSCMTLFAQATERDTGKSFRAALDRHCDGRMDPQTMVLLNSAK